MKHVREGRSGHRQPQFRSAGTFRLVRASGRISGIAIELALIVVFAIFLVLSFLLLDRMFAWVNQPGVSPFAHEILSAATGSFIIVVTTALLMHFQSTREKKNKYQEEVFIAKLRIYEQFVSYLFEADDDNLLNQEEILKIEDRIGTCCLVAGEDLVRVMSQFAYQMKVYGVVYLSTLQDRQHTAVRDAFINDVNIAILDIRNGNRTWLQKTAEGFPLANPENIAAYFVSLDEVVQAVRADLGVVSGDVSRLMEPFMVASYNASQTIPDPNKVDSTR